MYPCTYVHTCVYIHIYMCVYIDAGLDVDTDIDIDLPRYVRASDERAGKALLMFGSQPVK